MLYPSLPSEQRRQLGRQGLGLTIDPGFVHRRRIQTIIDDAGMRIVDKETQRLPELLGHELERRIDHIYTKVMLAYCEINNVPTLERWLTDFESPIFCGNVLLEPFDNFYKVDRAVSQLKSQVEPEVNVEFHYTTDRVKSSTLRGRLHEGSLVSMIVSIQKPGRKRSGEPLGGIPRRGLVAGASRTARQSPCNSSTYSAGGGPARSRFDADLTFV